MTKYDLMEMYYDDIKQTVMRCTEDAMRSHGTIQYAIWVDKNGTIDVDEQDRGHQNLLSTIVYRDKIWYLLTVIDAGWLDLDDYTMEAIEEDEDEEDEAEDGDDIWESGSLGIEDRDSLIDMIMETTDWDQKMAEIEDNFYYEG